MEAIWAVRERISEGLLHDGVQHKVSSSSHILGHELGLQIIGTIGFFTVFSLVEACPSSGFRLVPAALGYKKSRKNFQIYLVFFCPHNHTVFMTL